MQGRANNCPVKNMVHIYKIRVSVHEPSHTHAQHTRLHKKYTRKKKETLSIIAYALYNSYVRMFYVPENLNAFDYFRGVCSEFFARTYSSREITHSILSACALTSARTHIHTCTHMHTQIRNLFYGMTCYVTHDAGSLPADSHTHYLCQIVKYTCKGSR